MNRSPVSVPTDIRQINVADSNRRPSTSRAQRATATIRHLPPSINRLPRNRPGIAEPHTRQITRNHEPADTLRRHAKKRRRIRERKQIRSHGTNIVDYSTIYKDLNIRATCRGAFGAGRGVHGLRSWTSSPGSAEDRARRGPRSRDRQVRQRPRPGRRRREGARASTR